MTDECDETGAFPGIEEVIERKQIELWRADIPEVWRRATYQWRQLHGAIGQYIAKRSCQIDAREDGLIGIAQFAQMVDAVSEVERQPNSFTEPLDLTRVECLGRFHSRAL